MLFEYQCLEEKNHRFDNLVTLSSPMQINQSTPLCNLAKLIKLNTIANQSGIDLLRILLSQSNDMSLGGFISVLKCHRLKRAL